MKRLTDDVMRRYAHEHLMQDPRKHKNQRLSHIWRNASANQRQIHMPFHEEIDRTIPVGPISTQAAYVPPSQVEFTVGEPQDLCEKVEG